MYEFLLLGKEKRAKALRLVSAGALKIVN